MSDPGLRALALIATNVAVVTTGTPASPHGVTANVWGEGLEPPVVLVTLKRRGHSLGLVTSAGTFGVAALGEGQQREAVQFAGPAEMRFAETTLRWPGGVPVLSRCHAWFACEVTATHAFGEQQIVVGHVVESGVGTEPRPLIHHRGRFAALGDANNYLT